tara:strand:+ start:396 stop:569 length:174 start_codon:yes stop_codon:yes gene_type:complete
MPLREGSTKAAIRANIRELIKSGKPHKKAVAIAMQKAGKKKLNPRAMAASNMMKGMK